MKLCATILLFVLAMAVAPEILVEPVMIPMRDGVRLATDLYPPQGSDKLPVLLQRTPYGKSGVSLVEQAKRFAAAGYLVALQDCRGRYASEGLFSKYIGEGQDGYDSIEWLARHRSSDGSVGKWGTSYSAHVQAAAAKLPPPHPPTSVPNIDGVSTS